MKIAILGHRGIPGNYGGFETFAEELAVRLIKRGDAVRVYNRSHLFPSRVHSYKGVELTYLPTIRNKFLDTFVHTLFSVLHILFHRVDIVLAVNVGNSPLVWIPRIVGIPVVLNVDGLEWQRRKWSLPAKAYLRFATRIAKWTATHLVSDAKTIAAYYRNVLAANTTFIPYGAYVRRSQNPYKLRAFRLKPNRYFLYVSRFEPENNALEVVRAYRKAVTNIPLVMVGDSPYAKEYVAQVKRAAHNDKRIRFLGFVYGEGYKTLQQHAYAYIQATEVGGTHPALIEAMGYGNCVLVNDTPENREVAGGSALYFNLRYGGYALRRLFEYVTNDPTLVPIYRQRAQNRIRRYYQWETVTDQYEMLLRRILRHKRRASLTRHIFRPLFVPRPTMANN
ncbi:MAG: DUF1972 domain-containing protein [Parcubacteria group bacterium]|nr:DUF1972 domain-containing protein [Parcubacteria group bacterium]